MKICLLSDTYPPDVGGLAVSVRRNAQSLAFAGHEVHVVAPGESHPPGSRHREADGPLTVHRLGTQPHLRETLADWSDLAADLDVTHDFDLFHGHFLAYAGYIATLVARYRGKKSVISARGNDIDVMPFDYRRAPFVFKALEWADAIIAVTGDLARKAAALSGREDVHLIHNGVDVDFFVPQDPDLQLRETLGLDDRPVIGFVGEARAKKGLGRLLRIFPRLYQSLPVQMLLVGGVRHKDQSMVDFFLRQHADLPLYVVSPQPNQKMPRYYSLCDVVILPSLRDGLPNTLLEAMACGRPVLASAVGGMPDVITNGLDGVLLPSQDDEPWVDALRDTLQDSPMRESLGLAARQTVLNRFTPARELEATLEVYHTLRLSGSTSLLS